MQARKKFVTDVVNAAVSLQEGDPQDRLRVLAAAAEVMSSVAPERAKEFASEGVQLEIQLIASGKKPAVSLMERGQMSCSVAQDFVEMLPLASVPAAEQSILGALSACPKETLEPVKRKLKDAMQNGDLAPRALLATMQAEGLKSPWSSEQFDALFKSLPKDAERVRDDAPNFAAMFARVAPEIDPAVAGDAGLNLLEWLGRLEQGDERNLAVNITTGALQDLLGEEKKQRAFREECPGPAGGANRGPVRRNWSRGRRERLGAARHGRNRRRSVGCLARSALPASLRAREAAAHGFAAGTGGDPDASKKYFDMAFSALNEVWDQRANQPAASIVEEVSEAAAQVDTVTALRRTQGLTDPSAQAIGMLAVARVALSRQVPEAPAQPRAAEGHSGQR